MRGVGVRTWRLFSVVSTVVEGDSDSEAVAEGAIF